MAKASIFWDSSIQAYRLKMQADYAKIEKCIEFLKKFIPHSDRELIVKEDPSTKKKDYTWTFTEKYLQGTVDFMKLIFGAPEVACVTRAQVEATQQPRTPLTATSNPTASACYEFLKTISYEDAQKAYRSAAIRLHPDRGGDMEQMTKVNSLWTKIQKEIYGQ
jgi:hypothetical protein